jgi:hypothetical protein
MRIVLLSLTLLAALLTSPRLCVGQWRKVTDSGAPDSVLHDRMPPGWHITTGPAAILFDPSHHARGRFAVEAEIHLFPGESNEGYGVFLGGSGLDSSSSWTAFLIRKDGSATIERRVNSTPTVLVAGVKSPAIKPHTGGQGTTLNQIRVLVQGDSAIFSANGQRVAAISTRDLPLDGTFGFRVGRGLNLHVTNLDLVTRLAPFPIRR